MEQTEPKEMQRQEPADEFDSIADEFLSKQEQGGSGDSSDTETATGKESEQTDGAGDDQLKKSTEESDENQSGEEDSDPRDQYFRKGYNEAKVKFEKELEALKAQIPTKEQLEEFQKVTKSPEYIRNSMKAQGYTDEAINAKLRELGHNVPDSSDSMLNAVLKGVGVDPAKADDNTKALVGDIIKVMDAYQKLTMPQYTKPLEENLQSITRKETASRLVTDMRKVITDEGILDFAKDVEPAINEYLDKNPEATQEDVFQYFHQVNHKLSVERLKLGKKAKERQEGKANLRQNAGGGASEGAQIKKTGNFDDDFDSMADSLGLPPE